MMLSVPADSASPVIVLIVIPVVRIPSDVVVPAIPADPSRRIISSRYPDPAKAQGEIPCAVVKRCKAPVVVGCPCHSVGRPCPISVGIRFPTGIHNIGMPDIGGEGSVIVPGAVRIQLGDIMTDFCRYILGTCSRFSVVGISGPQVKIIHIECVEVGFGNTGVSLVGAAHISGMEESGPIIFRHFSCSTDYFERRFIAGAVETILPVGKEIGAGVYGVDSKTALLEGAVIGYIHED